MNNEKKEYHIFEGYNLEEKKTVWRYVCLSEVPINILVCKQGQEQCNCGNKLVPLVYQYNMGGTYSRKMIGRKCPNCGYNFFTEKTLNLCPDAYIFGGNINRKQPLHITKKKEKVIKSSNSELSKLPLTESNIERICNQFNIKCNVSNDIIFLSTNCGYWRIYLDGDKVSQVYHGNYKMWKGNRKKKKKCNEGFHQQMNMSTNFYDVVRYIYNHDKNLYVSHNNRCRTTREATVSCKK